MHQLNLLKYVLHFSIFILLLSVWVNKVEASGNILDGTVKASYSIYEDNSLSYTLSFEIQNNDSAKFMTSFEFTVPFKDYSAVNVSASNLDDYNVLAGEYNSIKLNFRNPIKYQERSSVNVNITVAAVNIDAAGNPDIDVINPVTNQSVYYTVTSPEALNAPSLSQNIEQTRVTENKKNIITFSSSDNLRIIWKKESLYSFRLKYQVNGEPEADSLINLPYDTSQNPIYYSKLEGIKASLYDDVGNIFGVAGSGEVNIEFQIDTGDTNASEQSINLQDTNYMAPDRESSFYKDLKLRLDDGLKSILSFLSENISMNRGFKVDRSMMSEIWNHLKEGRELNSFEASLAIHSVLRDAGVKAELRYGYITDPFEVNFPIAWIESSFGTIDLFSETYLNGQSVTKVTFGIWNDNEEDLALGVFGDTPEVIRIEPIANLDIDRTTSGISLAGSFGLPLEVNNVSNRILKIQSITLDGISEDTLINGYHIALLPGNNILGITEKGGTTIVTTVDGQSTSTSVEAAVSKELSEAAQTNIKTAILIFGGGVIIFLVFFVRRSPKELKFEEQS